MGFKPTLTPANLTSKPSIARMPTTQREWSDFVQSLGESLKGFYGSFTPTFTGFSSPPGSPTVYWKRIGTLVWMSFDSLSLGTSNSSFFTISNLPEQVTPIGGQTLEVPIVGLVDSGVESWGVASPIFGGTMAFGYEDTDTNTWTGSGDKGFNLSSGGNPTIIYDIEFRT